MAIYTGKLTPPDAQDSFIGADTEADTFRFTPLTLEAADTVIGGGGAFDDILQFTAGGLVDSLRFSGVSGIEEIRNAAAGNSYAVGQALVASSRAGTLVIRGGSGADSVNGSAVLDPALTLSFFSNGGADTLVGGAGADRFSVAAAFAGARSFTGNGGDDVLTTNPLAWSGADIFAGGTGTDRIVFSDTGSVGAAQLAGLSSVEEIQINGVFAFGLALGNAAVAQAGGTLTVISTGVAAAHAVDASAVTTGSVVFKAGSGADSFLGGAGDDTYETSDALATGNLGAGDDTLRLNTIGASGLVVDGGAGFDTIALAIGGVLDLSMATNFEEVELVKATTLTLAGTPGIRVLGSAFKDTVTLGGPNQRFFGFAGDDTVRITAASLVGALLNGGTQAAADTLRMTTPGTYDFRHAAVTGFERYELDTAPVGSFSRVYLPDQALDLVLRHAADVRMGANAAQTVLGSNRPDDITLGAAGQFVEAGGGNDTIRAAASHLVGGTMISGGVGTNDILVVTGSGTVDLAGAAVVLDVERIQFTGQGALTLDGAPGIQVNRGDFDDTVTAGGDGIWGTLGLGDDVLRLNADLLATASPNLMTGSDGTDTLEIRMPVFGGPVVVPARFVGFEKLDLTDLFFSTVTIQGSTNWEVFLAQGGLTVQGGAGNETFHMAPVQLTVRGGAGNDIFLTTTTANPIDGEGGLDEIRYIVAGATVSAMPGTWLAETVRLFGPHTFTANTLADLLIIGDASLGNSITLNGDGQTATGGSGADRLRVAAGTNVTLAGGEGSDTYVIRPGDPWSTPGQAIVDTATPFVLNVIEFDTGGAVTVDFNQHSIANIDQLLVTDAGAQLTVTIGDAMLATADGSNGGTPDDLFIVPTVAVNLGARIDASGLTGANLVRIEGTGGGAFNGSDTFSGGAGHDFLLGGAGSDSLSGNGGNDILQGEGGNDSLSAGSGADSLVGGSGGDMILLGALDAATDTIRYIAITDGTGDINDSTGILETAADRITGFDATPGATHDVIKLNRSGLGLGAGEVVVVPANGVWNIGTGAVFIFESDSGNNDVLLGGTGNNFTDLAQIAGAVNTDNGAGTGSVAGRTVGLVVSNDTAFPTRRTGIYVWTDTDGDNLLEATDVVRLLTVLDGVTANALGAAGAIVIA